MQPALKVLFVEPWPRPALFAVSAPALTATPAASRAYITTLPVPPSSTPVQDTIAPPQIQLLEAQVSTLVPLNSLSGLQHEVTRHVSDV